MSDSSIVENGQAGLCRNYNSVSVATYAVYWVLQLGDTDNRQIGEV